MIKLYNRSFPSTDDEAKVMELLSLDDALDITVRFINYAKHAAFTENQDFLTDEYQVFLTDRSLIFPDGSVASSEDVRKCTSITKLLERAIEAGAVIDPQMSEDGSTEELFQKMLIKGDYRLWIQVYHCSKDFPPANDIQRADHASGYYLKYTLKLESEVISASDVRKFDTLKTNLDKVLHDGVEATRNSIEENNHDNTIDNNLQGNMHGNLLGRFKEWINR
jgi:hypothetical protein